VAEVLARVLVRQQQLLLVLANCEHVIGAAAALCGRLLQACDDVRVLATSWEPLRIAGEAAYRLAPLPVPDPDDADGVAGAEAVSLFSDRARAIDASFALTGENRRDVARLVVRLDGMGGWRGPARMAGCGTGCWRRCAATPPDCWPRLGSRTRRRPRWPGTR
jgi:predicted ATPase